MRKRNWMRWVMAAAMAALLVGPLPAQASELEEAGELEVSQEGFPASVEESEEMVVVQASAGITSTVDGDTIVFTGEGKSSDLSFSSSIKHIKFQNCKVVGSMNSAFKNRDNLRSIDFSGLDTSQVTDMSYMFYSCDNLTSLDLSGLDTSQVTDMSYMFKDCISLRSLDVSGFDTSKVTNMDRMFDVCSSLTNLDVSGFDTSKVDDMSAMFGACKGLRSLDLSSFDTSRVGTMVYMFTECTGLTSLDLSGFDTSVAGMKMMLYGCGNLRSLKTPKNLGAKTIDLLPATFFALDGRETGKITNQFRDTTLIRKGTTPGGDDDVFAVYDGCIFTRDKSEQVRCYNSDGTSVINDFKCDGTYTYYFQLDGTAMTDRLTYHPDGIHVIYFDGVGHEVFSDFANVKKSIAGDSVDDMCFFNVYGYMYVDTLTYDKSGKKLYYVNEYGVLERKGWFAFSGNEFNAGIGFSGRAGGFGYANGDCSLVVNRTVNDWDGQEVYIQGDGHMFKD